MKKLCFIIISLILSAGIFAAEKKADIIFSSDIHSFIQASPKVKTLIDKKKAENPDTMIFDGGDFSMGTLFQTVFESQASELRTLGILGVEATTMGNHEFDYGPKALSKMFQSALDSGDPLPSFVLCNANWNKNNDYTNTVKNTLVDKYGCKDYIMLQKGNVSVAVIGVFGIEAFLYSPGCEMTFEDPIKAVKRTVETIKKNEKADLIVCISHSGVNSNIKKSEDEQLALAVPELDVIISGHTHTTLEKPIIHGNTVIGACGAYNAYLGNISLTQKEDGRWKLENYSLDDLSQNIPEDSYTKERITAFEQSIDKEYLSKYNLTSNQILSVAAKDFDINTETGYLMADAVSKSIQKLGQKVDVVVVPSGVIRGTYKKGPVKVSDTFESYSLGLGDDGLTGYPLIELYVTGKELKNMAEIDCSLSSILDTVRLFTSGFAYSYNPKRFILNKVTKAYIVNSDGTKTPVEDKKLYRVITDKYTGMMIGGITGTTKGLITIIPKYEDGTVITNWDNSIIKKADGSEQKGWISLAEQYGNYDVLPDFSKAESEFIMCEPSLNPVKLLASPSKLYQILSAVLLGIIVLITAIIILVKKLKHKK